MLALGYIFPEAELKRRRKRSVEQSKRERPGGSEWLFKLQHVTKPAVRGVSVSTRKVAGTILLMRVRRASESTRRTQIQIPKPVIQSDFFTGINRLVSDHDGREHSLRPASARGAINTIKVDIPEIERMSDPVLRLERRATGITYRAFDASSVLGAPIHQALLNGFEMNPPTTLKTKADRSIATWSRFI
jgi:hemin uptake protein HemP